jgi:flagellin FlaB
MAKLLWNARLRGSTKGEIGISTLIIFIALVLVAAIAASVIISTTFNLRDQAIATAESARHEVTGPIKILNFYGDRDDNMHLGGGTVQATVQFLVFRVSVFDGAEGINMVNMRLNYVDSVSSFIYTLYPCTSVASVTNGGAPPSGAQFTADEVPTGTAGNGWAPASSLCFLDNDNILQIAFDVTAARPAGLPPGTTVQVAFLPGSGPAVTKTFTMPNSYDANEIIPLL